MLIDTHCHLHDSEWFTPEQAEQFLREAHDNNVQKIICIGTNPEDSFNARDFAESHDDIYWTYGIHPEFATDDKRWDEDISLLLERIRSYDEEEQRNPVATGVANMPRRKKLKCSRAPVAIGEVGLDYHYDGYDRAAQIRLFERMLQLALDLHLPVSLHIREAFTDTFAILDNFPQITGVVHSFTGSKRDLRQALERGFYIGVNGLCTYTTNPLPPLEKMVLETDAPFLTPAPFRGTINKPGYVKVIATYLTEKLGVAEVNIVEQTTQNARNIFQI